MWLKELHLQNYRNYQSLHLQLDSGLNLFVGENAQGKTNLLEAIYLLATGRSFRATKDLELIRQGEVGARISGKVARDADITLEVSLGNDTPKKLLVNNKSTSMGYFVGRLNAVLFVPDDLQLIKGSPGNRRTFLDSEISQVDSIYRSHLLRYQKVLSQRNQLLKDLNNNQGKAELLDLFDQQMVDCGSKIIEKRAQSVHKLGLLSRLMHRRITDGQEELNLVYAPFFSKSAFGAISNTKQIEEAFWQSIKEYRVQEINRGFSLVGPQRDDLLFFINDQEARIFASQGQQRTAILACRLAEMEYMRSETGKYPLVLLDDVLSELDLTRRRFLLKIVRMNVQTIITTTHVQNFDDQMLGNASLFQIQAGKIKG